MKHVLLICAALLAALSAAMPAAADTHADAQALQPAYWEHNADRWQTQWVASAAGKAGQSLELVARPPGDDGLPGRSTTTFWPGGMRFDLADLTELSQTLFSPASAECNAGGGLRATVFFADSTVGQAVLYPENAPCATTDVWRTQDFLQPYQIVSSTGATTIAGLHAAIAANNPDYTISKVWFQFDAHHLGGIQVDDFMVKFMHGDSEQVYRFAEFPDAVCNTAFTDCDSPAGAVVAAAGIGPRTFATGSIDAAAGLTWLALGDGPSLVPQAFGVTRAWSITDPDADCTAGATTSWHIAYADDLSGSNAVALTEEVPFSAGSCRSDAAGLPDVDMVPAGKYLLLAIQNNDASLAVNDPTGLLVHSPDSLPGFPTPGLATLALLGAGMLMVVAAVALRRGA